MSLVQPYDPKVFQTLKSPFIVSRDFNSLGVSSYLQDQSELSKLFSQHQIEADFAVEILHRHFDIAPENRLVKVGRVVTPWSDALVKSVEQQLQLGSVVPEAIHVYGDLYHPYEYIFLTKDEILAVDGHDRFDKYKAFLEEFGKFVQAKGIAHVLGLRLLSKDERRRALDPAIRDYEVTDDGRHLQKTLKLSITQVAKVGEVIS
jgi:hypothetical protein